MPYKSDCGFRKLNLCGFKPEDCVPEKCDMFNIPFTAKDILMRSKKEHKAVKELTEKLLNMKKSGEHKTNKAKYQQLKLARNDKVYGMLKLSKAYMHCKRTGK